MVNINGIVMGKLNYRDRTLFSLTIFMARIGGNIPKIAARFQVSGL